MSRLNSLDRCFPHDEPFAQAVSAICGTKTNHACIMFNRHWNQHEYIGSAGPWNTPLKSSKARTGTYQRNAHARRRIGSTWRKNKSTRP